MSDWYKWVGLVNRDEWAGFIDRDAWVQLIVLVKMGDTDLFLWLLKYSLSWLDSILDMLSCNFRTCFFYNWIIFRQEVISTVLLLLVIRGLAFKSWRLLQLLYISELEWLLNLMLLLLLQHHLLYLNILNIFGMLSLCLLTFNTFNVWFIMCVNTLL